MKELRSFIIICTIFVVFSLWFLFFPQMDLHISNFFFSNHHFFLQEEYLHWYSNYFRLFFQYFTWLFVGILILIIIIGLFSKKIHQYINVKACFFLLVCFSIAPGLLINQTLKDHWGRARPFQIQEFGGDKKFTPVWVKSQECKKNCSFSSGETANIFCYLALLFVIRRKRWVICLITLFGLLMILERVAQGAHFFSDAIVSIFLDYIIIWVSYHLLFTPKENYYLRPLRTPILISKVGDIYMMERNHEEH